MPSLLICMTGASGSIYGVRLLQNALGLFDPIYLVLSGRAREVIHHELGLALGDVAQVPRMLLGEDGARVHAFSPGDMGAPFASGSAVCDATVIAPCTMGTAARIAHGVSSDLITRAADVCLKERRTLILVPRETPYSTIHLQNLLALSQAGAVIMPAAPPFYHRPDSISELLQPLVDRILAHAGAPRPQAYRWAGSEATGAADSPDRGA